MPPDLSQGALPESEVEITCMIGTGPGGQHRQKTASCVRARHIPTGLTAVVDARDQHQNRKLALRILAVRVHEQKNEQAGAEYAEARRRQLGGGTRGNKIRTYNFMSSRATDARTGKKVNVELVIKKGRFDLLL